MKHHFIIILAASLSLQAMAADKGNDNVKTGWNFGPLPAVSYSTDKGLQYGVCCDIFNYGDGSDFPNYKYKFATELSRFTKGDTRAHVFFDGRSIVPGLRLSGAVTFINSPLLPFYGFNGLENYYKENDLGKESGLANYNYNRNFLRILADCQGDIAAVPHLRWAAGMSFFHYSISDIDTEKYGYSTVSSLYNVYRGLGIIKDAEAEGGNRLEFKAGAVYDSRDAESAPTKGIWAELYLNGSPDLASDGFSYLKLCAHFRNYISIIPDNRLTFAYHIAYQGTLGGEAPFYIQNNITTLFLKQIVTEGLGSINTVRGTLYDRLIGNDYLWANFELRIKLASFRFLGQQWYVATNPFFDLGSVTKPYRAEEMAGYLTLRDAGLGTPKVWTADDVATEARKPHMSAGAGLKFVMNRNFIVSVEAAKAFNANDNPGLGMAIGLNYIF